MKPLIVIIALAIAAFRTVLLFRDFNPHVERGYEAFAHLFEGGLVGVWLSRVGWPGVGHLAFALLFGWCTSTHWCMRTASALANVEIVCVSISLYQKFNP